MAADEAGAANNQEPSIPSLHWSPAFLRWALANAESIRHRFIILEDKGFVKRSRFSDLSLYPAFLTARSTLCSADLLVGCVGGVLAARAKPRLSIPFTHTVTEQTVSGVGRETHATAGQEAGATN